MSIVSSLNTPVVNNIIKFRKDKASSDVASLITSITYMILLNSPEIVAQVAVGELKSEVLETAIIKELDTYNYLFDISRDDIIARVFAEMFGYGALQKYVDDVDVSDIDGTKYDEFTIKKNGIRYAVDLNLGSESNFDMYCKRVAVINNGILNENDTHCRVTDDKKRLRINVAIRPTNVSGPSISIRKHRLKSYTVEDLTSLNMLTPEMASHYKEVMQSRESVLFFGVGGSGKTTLLRAGVNSMPELDRVLICETDAEIFPDKKYCIERRIKKEYEGGRKVKLKDLVRDGLTESLDSYVIGEFIGDETWEGVRAAHTGHRVLGTGHSKSAEDGLYRLVTLSKGAGIGESEKTVKEMIGRSFEYIYFLDKFKVKEVIRVKGYSSITDKFDFEYIFKM